MGSEWYVLRDGEKYGPFTSDRMSAGARDGELRRQDLVWCEGMSDWQPAGDVLPPFRAIKDASPAPKGSMASKAEKSKIEASQPPEATNAKAVHKTAVRAEVPKQLSAADMQKREAASARLLFRLGEILSVFMRTPEFRGVPLGVIRTLVIPP